MSAESNKFVDTATPETINHYLRPEVIKIITEVADDGTATKAGNGDFVKWYTSEMKLFDLSNRTDYAYLISHCRSLYWTLNFFEPSTYKRAKIDDNDIVGTLSETITYTLGIDIDHCEGMDIHTPEVKKAVEDMASFYVKEIQKTQPTSVHAAYSGGGIYVYIHHRIWDRYFKAAEDQSLAVYVLINSYNRWIAEKSEEFFTLHPEHIDKCKADALNNAKRVFKTILSVHKELPYAVIPLDTNNILIKFDDAKLPLKSSVIEQAAAWYKTFDTETKFHEELKKYYEDVISKWENKERIREIQISQVALTNTENFPPCIKTILSAQSMPAGKTRATAIIASFLGQTGWSKEEAHALYLKVVNNLHADTSNIFESFYKKMNCPNCVTINRKGGGFPNLDMGEIGICNPELKCKSIKNPIQYLTHYEKVPADNYEKATCKSCKSFPDNGYCTTKRTGVTPDKGACNRFIPEGTPDHIEEKEQEAPQHIRDAANEVLEKGDPVKYIFDAHQRLHIGDGILTSTRIAAVGNQSASNTKGIQPSTDGNSGKGKSDGDKKFVHLLPRGHVLSGSISDKVLYYKKDLKPGTYIYSDDVVLSEDLTSTIKRATSNFQGYTPHHTLDKDRNVLENHIPPRIVWGLNSIDNVNSLQLINRQFGGSVDESAEQDENVLLYQKACGMLGTDELPETDDVLICREIVRDIKKYLFKVIIPFNYLIEWRDSSNRRNFDMFEDMIKGFAVFRYRQREKHGDLLVAELQDFEDAEKLYGYRTEQQGRKLTDPELRLIKILNEISIADSKELQDLTGLSQGRISHLMKGKGKDSDSGLLHKVKELHCEKRTESLKNGNGTVTKMYYTISGFDENKYRDKVVWIEDEARKEYEAYYRDITRLLLLKINNSEELITLITNITLIHSNVKYNKLLHIILNPQKDFLLGYFAEKGNKGNNLTTDSDNAKVISGNKRGNITSEICGFCEEPLNGSREFGPSGTGPCHPNCISLHQKAIQFLRSEYNAPEFSNPNNSELLQLLYIMDTKLEDKFEMDKKPAELAVQAFCHEKRWQAT